MPIHLGILGKIVPLIAERTIDEEGNLLGNQWLLTRMSGFGNIYYLIDRVGASLLFDK